jgi:hypothetical protein
MIPGSPYSFVAVLEPGRTSWTAILDAQRLGHDDEDTAIAAAQLRTVVDQLIAAGHWKASDPEIWIVGDTGYDGPVVPSCWPICRSACWCGCDRVARLRSDGWSRRGRARSGCRPP